jgi:murein DD-endopeptidase MepM/ murein hydrolase activator NlpD
MPASRWTLMLVPHDNERVRSFQVTGNRVRTVVTSVLLVTILLGTFSIAFFVKQAEQVQANTLRKENELLAAEVTGMREQMEELNRSIVSLSEKDEKFRTIAGLPSIDDDVRGVGIGGPGTTLAGSGALSRMNPERGTEVESTSQDLGTLTRRAQLLQSSMDDAIQQLQRNRERLAATPTIAPAHGHLSSLFSNSRYHPVLRISRPHKGIDIAAKVGEPILAAGAGRVTFAGWKSGGYGNTVEIDHGYGYVTRYAHASRVRVRSGQQVNRGDLIADVGATGLVSGPHLHYEVEVNGRQVDPLNFIIGDAIP